MDTSRSPLAEADIQRQARRGLTLYLAAVVVLTALFDVLVITLSPVWILGRMFAPAAASVVARLVLREGFTDVSFRFGGRRTWKMILLAVFFPIIIGLVAYGVAWATGLAQFDPEPSAGLFARLAGEGTSSPAMVFVMMIILTTFVGVFPNALHPGRPPSFDTALFARRNVVERCVNRLKQWRGIATRYEKRAVNYRAAVVIVALMVWLTA